MKKASEEKATVIVTEIDAVKDKPHALNWCNRKHALRARHSPSLN